MINGLAKILGSGGALSTVGSAIDSVDWNVVATGVAYGVVIAAASVLAGPLGGASAAAIIIGANAIDTDSVVNRGNKYEA
ncbi:hypothetical protein [uncultured Streptococcus sp.]|uniref:hypothetical protein n=1 Tax=uncultured Streptococcus sp. TaxID=83427 RepID=UPI003211A429